MKRSILMGAALALLSTSSHAAEVTWWKKSFPNEYGFKIQGGIVAGDMERFSDGIKDMLVKNYPKEKFTQPLPTNFRITVSLDSPGGSVKEAIIIGDFIRKERMDTYVPRTATCASACGLIWLSGQNRYVSVGAHVGFHAASSDKNKEISSSGNAIVGAYLGSLGLSYPAIEYLTKAPTDKMEWLTARVAIQYGIKALQCDVERCSID